MTVDRNFLRMKEWVPKILSFGAEPGMYRRP